MPSTNLTYQVGNKDYQIGYELVRHTDGPPVYRMSWDGNEVQGTEFDDVAKEITRIIRESVGE